MTSDAFPFPSTETIAVAVLSAGRGTRMISEVPKALHPVCGVPLVERVLRAGLAIGPDYCVCVVSDDLDDLPERLGMVGHFETVIQTHEYGTAGAVQSGLAALPPCTWLVSLLGDGALLTGETIQQLIDHARAARTRITVLTCLLPEAGGYGRIERDRNGFVTRIVEKKNDDPARRVGPTEINSGIMVLDAEWARWALAQLKRSAGQGELLLTDLIELAVSQHEPSEPWPISTVDAPPEIALGINNRAELARVEAIAYQAVRQRHQMAGVTIVGEETVFIDETVQIEQDVTILPFSIITGTTRIATGSTIGPSAILHDAVIERGGRVQTSTVTRSTVGVGADVGPYAHVREGSVLGSGVHVGTSTEVKASTLGAGTRAGHFSYLGDAVLGERVNVGAGTVTANFDGVEKHPTHVGDDAFIGSDTVIVAPRSIGTDARTGAGSVVTKDVAEGSTVVGVPARAVASRRSAAVKADPHRG